MQSSGTWFDKWAFDFNKCCTTRGRYEARKMRNSTFRSGQTTQGVFFFFCWIFGANISSSSARPLSFSFAIQKVLFCIDFSMGHFYESSNLWTFFHFVDSVARFPLLHSRPVCRRVGASAAGWFMANVNIPAASIKRRVPSNKRRLSVTHPHTLV